jgi:hypothetical protein
MDIARFFVTILFSKKLFGAFLHVFATWPIGRAEDAGEYTCTATSQTDHFSRNIRLLIQSKILKKKKTFFALVSLNELIFQNNFTLLDVANPIQNRVCLCC